MQPFGCMSHEMKQLGLLLTGQSRAVFSIFVFFAFQPRNRWFQSGRPNHSSKSQSDWKAKGHQPSQPLLGFVFFSSLPQVYLSTSQDNSLAVLTFERCLSYEKADKTSKMKYFSLVSAYVILSYQLTVIYWFIIQLEFCEVCKRPPVKSIAAYFGRLERPHCLDLLGVFQHSSIQIKQSEILGKIERRQLHFLSTFPFMLG